MGSNVVRPKVVIVPYDPRWSIEFQALAQVYERTLVGFATAVEHVGSTSVPELAAKPIIDIDVVIPSSELLAEVTRRLEGLGYEHRGDGGIAGRESFAALTEDVPHDGSRRRWRAHNLYVCAADNPELRRHLAFRDWLRADPTRISAYADLKLRLAETYRYDRDAYSEAKTEFIERALLQAESTLR